MAHVTLLEYDALAFVPDTTNPPTFGQVQHRPYLAFPDDATKIAYTKAVAMPGQYAASTLKASIGYSMTSANTSKNIDFEVSVEAVTDGDALDLHAGDSFDTLNEISLGETVPATAGYLGVATMTLTNKDSVAAGDLFRLKLARDHDDSHDDAAGDARVWWVEIWENTA